MLLITFIGCVSCILSGLPRVFSITDNNQSNTTVQATAGEDVFLSCRTNPDPHIYQWKKNGRPVFVDQAYRNNRLYVLKADGLIILNTEAEDGGSFTCITFDGSFKEKYYTLQIVAPEVDNDDTTIQCGYVRERSRIIGGRVVNKPGLFPWMALLWHKETNKPFCGGALLSRRFVVTAAHCFLQSGFPASQVEVRLGEHNITMTEPYERTMAIAEIIPHPNYHQDTYDSDILLLRLQQPVVFSDFIVPICLPSQLRGERMMQAGRAGTVAGWGTSDGSDVTAYQEVLKRAKLTIKDHHQCGNQHRSNVFTNNMFCALGGNQVNGIRDACNGDSGGPFIVKEEDRSYLIGIVSWGVGCGLIDFPGVYTRVSRYRDWILENINADLQTCEETSFQTEEDLNQEQSRIESLEDQVSVLQGQVQAYESRTGSACTTPPPAPVTTPPSTIAPFAETPIPCRRGSCWHVGGYRIWGQCVNGNCECNSPLYSRASCLPTVGSCNIREDDTSNTHGIPMSSRSGSLTVYSCEGDQGTSADVHVLGVYEGNVHSRPPAPGTMNVMISQSHPSTRPVVLVFSNYEPVNWVLDVPSTLNIEKVILISYYSDISSVSVAEGVSHNITVEKKPRTTPRGYGKDSGGGNTAGMFMRLSQEYGAVTSFAGTYRADSWSWNLAQGNMAASSTTATEVDSSSGETVEVTENSWTPYQFRFQNNWNSCHGSRYVRKRPISDGEPGQFVGAVICTSDRYKLLLSDTLDGEFKNIADTSGHGADHCEFVGAPAGSTSTLDSNFWHSPSTTGYYRDDWGSQIQLGVIGGGMGSLWTGRYYPKWYECGVTIP